MPSAPSETILTERRGRVFWVTFNRPKVRNALTLAMYERLYEILGEIERAEDAGAVVLAGAGDRAFVAGTDIAEFESFRTPEDALGYEQRMDEILTRLERLPLPTIAALRGACTGGGAAIACACDLRIAAPSLRFGFPMARTLGNCLSIKNYARLEALVGESEVKRMLYTSDLVPAERAAQIGLVSEIVAESALLSRAQELAAQIAGNAPLTIRATKEALRRLREQGPSAADDDLVLACYQSNDFKEGMTAFLEKREARWKGE